MIAESIIAAAATTGFKVPVVVRLQGTNSDKGLKMVRTHEFLSELHANHERSLRNQDCVTLLSSQTLSSLLKRLWKSHESQCRELSVPQSMEVVINCPNFCYN